MSVGENKAIARRWSEELWGRDNLAATRHHAARDVLHALYSPGTGPVRVLEILTPGGFESYLDEYEEIVSSTMDEEEHRRVRAELSAPYG